MAFVLENTITAAGTSTQDEYDALREAHAYFGTFLNSIDGITTVRSPGPSATSFPAVGDDDYVSYTLPAGVVFTASTGRITAGTTGQNFANLGIVGSATDWKAIFQITGSSLNDGYYVMQTSTQSTYIQVYDDSIYGNQLPIGANGTRGAFVDETTVSDITLTIASLTHTAWQKTYNVIGSRGPGVENGTTVQTHYVRWGNTNQTRFDNQYSYIGFLDQDDVFQDYSERDSQKDATNKPHLCQNHRFWKSDNSSAWMWTMGKHVHLIDCGADTATAMYYNATTLRNPFFSPIITTSDNSSSANRVQDPPEGPCISTSNLYPSRRYGSSTTYADNLATHTNSAVSGTPDSYSLVYPINWDYPNSIDANYPYAWGGSTDLRILVPHTAYTYTGGQPRYSNNEHIAVKINTSYYVVPHSNLTSGPVFALYMGESDFTANWTN